MKYRNAKYPEWSQGMVTFICPKLMPATARVDGTINGKPKHRELKKTAETLRQLPHGQGRVGNEDWQGDAHGNLKLPHALVKSVEPGMYPLQVRVKLGPAARLDANLPKFPSHPQNYKIVKCCNPVRFAEPGVMPRRSSSSAFMEVSLAFSKHLEL